MDTIAHQEPSSLPATVTWAFTAALMALGVFISSTLLQFRQTYSSDPAQFVAARIFKTSKEKLNVQPEETLQFILAYRIGLLLWLAIFGALYLVVSFSFRRGNKKARSTAAVLALISTAGLFLPGFLNPLWVFLNSVSAALLFTRSSRMFYAAQSVRNFKR